ELLLDLEVVVELAELGVQRCVLHLDRRRGSCLIAPDLAFHALELGGGVERRERRNALRDRLLGLGTTLARDQTVALAQGRLVLALKELKLLLQFLDRVLLGGVLLAIDL